MTTISQSTTATTTETVTHDRRFQVDLGGIIELLSEHLYSSPAVFLRELLQNAVDAGTSRRELEPDYRPSVRVRVDSDPTSGRPRLVFEDDGIGLSEPEIHELLATIGASSKRQLEGDPRAARDFIGRFGIGLLSGFLVSDEILVETRSARDPGAAEVRWRGRRDGTYSVESVGRRNADAAPGTRVTLVARRGAELWLELGEVLDGLRRYGEHLDVDIEVASADNHTRIGRGSPPWAAGLSHDERMQRGRELLGASPIDAIPIATSRGGGARGVAYILGHASRPGTQPAHRVYVRGMLVCERAVDVLPEWAFFVRCVINGRELRPTASREALYSDDTFHEVRRGLGEALRAALERMARHDPGRLVPIVALHARAIASLAVHDADCYELFMPLLPFGSTLGPISFDTAPAPGTVVRYLTSRDELRQIRSIARAQNLRIVDASWQHVPVLLERLPELYPDVEVRRTSVREVVGELDRLSGDDDHHVHAFVERASQSLAPFGCRASCRRFTPSELPVLLTRSDDAALGQAASAERSRAPTAWQRVLTQLASRSEQSFADLCFNASNPLVQRLARIDDAGLQQTVVLVLYTQALLLGHHPLGEEELDVMSHGMVELVERAMAGVPMLH